MTIQIPLGPALLLLAFVAPAAPADSPLADAAEKADWERVRRLLDQNVNPNTPQVDGMTALHWAVWHDHTATAHKLIKCRANIGAKNRYGVTALSLACKNGNGVLVERLLKAGADANTTLPGGETALMTAARTGRIGAVKALLKHGADVNAKERNAQTAIMWAAAEGHADVVSLLIKTGADYKTPLKSGFTPLFFAVRQGHSEVVNVLLAAGVDVNSTMRPKINGPRAPRRGTSPLLLAVENGHFELAVRLLKAGADPNDQRSGFTPLHAITWVRKPNRGDGVDGDPPPTGSGNVTSLQFVKKLVESGADVNARLRRGRSGRGRLNHKGATPFMFAADTADTPLMQLLLELGADPTIPNADRCPPLLAAAGIGTMAPGEEAGTEDQALEAVRILLERGADLNAVDDNRETAMHGAAYKSLPKMVQFLADHGADIKIWNKKNKYGWTPLMIAEGHRVGNFKPAHATIAAIHRVMRAAGVEPPTEPTPRRPRNQYEYSAAKKEKQAAQKAPRPPNVVVIFADDLGYGDLGCYGATHVNTPHIDRLARQGRRFTDAHSASAVCTPSRYALLTGRYPVRRGNLWGPVFLRSPLVVDPDRTTVADIAKQAGYATACIGKWHLGFGAKTPTDWNAPLKPGPLELGFDYYFGVPVVNSHPPFVFVEDHHVVGLTKDDPLVYRKKAQTRNFDEKFGVNLIGGAKAAHQLYDDEKVGAALTAKAVDWIRGQVKKETPFFLYFATTNIHHPFTPAKRFHGTSKAGPYGDFIHELDWIVGQVMKTLDETGVADNTLVIFTSDNGGMLNRGGQAAWKAGHRMNADLLGFKFDAWEGGHRVPFIARWPGRIAPDSQSNSLVSNIDLLATVAALTGRKLGPDDGPDSFNLLSALTGAPDTQVRDHLLIAPARKTHLVLRKGDWIYIGAQGHGGFQGASIGEHLLGGPAAHLLTRQVNSDIENGKIKPHAPKAQLYNLANDPTQKVNVIRNHPEVARRMKAELQRIRANPTAPHSKAVRKKK